MLFVDVDRHEVFYFLSGNRDERVIAFRTASERLRKNASWKCGKDLLELCADIVFCDEQVVGRQGTFSKGCIPRQDHPVLLERKTDDAVVIERSVVEDVEAQKSQTFCEPAQHDIGDEFHFFTTGH